MGYRGWVRIPATSRRNPTNPDKIPTEPAKKYRKIISKSGPGGSPEPPESLGEPSGTCPSDENAKNQFLAHSSRRRNFCRGRFWDNFGIRPEARNRQKTAPEAKKCIRRRRRKRFLLIFLDVAVRSGSPDRFLEGLTLQNCAPTTTGARF